MEKCAKKLDLERITQDIGHYYGLLNSTSPGITDLHHQGSTTAEKAI
jgi:hypothetical protein